jgi:hypothetical protein
MSYADFHRSNGLVLDMSAQKLQDDLRQSCIILQQITNHY